LGGEEIGQEGAEGEVQGGSKVLRTLVSGANPRLTSLADTACRRKHSKGVRRESK